MGTIDNNYPTQQRTAPALGELAQLHLTATVTNAILLLVAVFVAALLGLSVTMILYSVIGVAVVSIIDYAMKMRRTIGYILGMRLGHHELIRQENQELKQEVKREQQELKVASQVVDNLRFKASEPESQVIITKGYVPYSPAAHYQQCIDDALLIFDTAMQGQRASREAMCPKILSQDRWEQGREWLIGAKVLEYRTKKSVVWHTTERRIARGMLTLYASKHKETT